MEFKSFAIPYFLSLKTKVLLDFAKICYLNINKDTDINSLLIQKITSLILSCFNRLGHIVLLKFKRILL